MKLYIGIDWSAKKHDLCFMNEQGGVLEQLEIEHNQAGLKKFEESRKKYAIGVEDCYVGIETARNLIIDFLLNQGYRNIFILAPHLIQGNRTRYAVSRGHNDASDAKLIAEILRTDRGRLIPWEPDSLLTQQIRALVSAIDFLTTEMVRVQNRLRDTLERYYPQATILFSKLDTRISLEFIMLYPNPESAKALTLEEFRSFCKANRYPKPKRIAEIYGRLYADFPKSNPSTVLIFQDEVVSLAEMLVIMKDFQREKEKQLEKKFKAHPDYEIYQSLPGTGKLLAPALLAKLGDNRARFPNPEVLQAVAGTSPVTFSSGKRKTVRFRYACDHQFRKYAQSWAMHSVESSSWARTYFESILPSSNSASHAYRRLANRWLKILWRLWMDVVSYDEVYHLKQRAKFVIKQ